MFPDQRCVLAGISDSWNGGEEGRVMKMATESKLGFPICFSIDYVSLTALTVRAHKRSAYRVTVVERLLRCHVSATSLWSVDA